MHVMETPPVGAILQLAATQIEVALQTAESQVASLSEAVAAMAAIAATLPVSVETQASVIRRHTSDAMIAMQYHDQLMQRLAHVRDALTDLRGALVEPIGADGWRQVLSAVRSRFSMEDERLLFDKILAWPAEQGASPRATSADSARGCVELF